METALVAGVGPGLGASLARAFARAGMAVGLVSRRADSSDPVAREIIGEGGRAIACPADVTDPESVRAALDKLRLEFGPVTVLAYNASGYGRGGFLEIDPEVIRKAFDVGAMGAVYLARAVIPDMLAAGHGFISFTGATAALRGRAGFAPLAIAKASLRMLAQSLAREFHPAGIHVLHVIVDGQIDTPRLREREPHRERPTVISPDAIADSVVQVMRQPRDAWSHEIDLRPHVESF